LDAPFSRQGVVELTGATLYTIRRTLEEWECQDFLLAERMKVSLLDAYAIATIGEDLPTSESETEK
jgi:hypothetical protein